MNEYQYREKKIREECEQKKKEYTIESENELEDKKKIIIEACRQKFKYDDDEYQYRKNYYLEKIIYVYNLTIQKEREKHAFFLAKNL